MNRPARLRRAWRQFREGVRFIARADAASSEKFWLWYPAGSWYAVHAPEMLALLEETAAHLERDLGLTFAGRTRCFVMDPETAMAAYGFAGIAHRDRIVVGFPERHLSTFATTAAHELAHVLAFCLGRYPPPFKGEGFACWATARIGVDRRPCGVPLHYHLAWLLSVGVCPRLEELWERRDYSAELYDLAWSFAAFLVRRFGPDAYFAFYRSDERNLPARVESTLDLPLSKLEAEWHDLARRSVDLKARPVRCAHRYDGALCGRAAWLNARARSRPA